MRMSNEEIDKILYTEEVKELIRKDFLDTVKIPFNVLEKGYNSLKNKIEDKMPCNNCQGGGCDVCSGTGFFIHT